MRINVASATPTKSNSDMFDEDGIAINLESPDPLEGKPMELPLVITPEEMAKHFGWSPRLLRAEARRLGACRILGNRMVLIKEDVDVLLEAFRPKQEEQVSFGVGGGYAALLKLRAKQAKACAGAPAKKGPRKS